MKTSNEEVDEFEEDNKSHKSSSDESEDEKSPGAWSDEEESEGKEEDNENISTRRQSLNSSTGVRGVSGKFECDICHKRYSRIQTLRAHKKAHLREFEDFVMDLS